MPIVNIVCPICTEIFTNADQVFSTNCGHLFHSVCLNGWLARDRTCPKCRKQNPAHHQLQLRFEETDPVNKTENQNIEVQIKSSEEKVAELLIQTQQLEEDFLKLQNQYSLTDSGNRELESKLSQMNSDAEGDFMRLQAEYTEVSEIRKQFEDRINQLCLENECTSRELQIITDENERINAGVGDELFNLPNNALGEQMKGMQQKLKFATEQLQKEINLNTLLSVDIMKLQSSINNNRLAEPKENATSKDNINPKSKPKHSRYNSPQYCNRYVKSVLIKGLPFTQLNASLENVVINLAFKMNIFLIPDDVDNVNIMNNNLKKSDSIILCVQFKEIATKMAFLSNSKNLQNVPDFGSVVVEEFMDNESCELFVYAKTKLHNRGLIYFYIEDNKVFAKKHRMHSDSIHIQDKAQVDIMALTYDMKKTFRN